MIILRQSCYFCHRFLFYLNYLDFVGNVKSAIQHPCLCYLSDTKGTEIQNFTLFPEKMCMFLHSLPNACYED